MTSPRMLRGAILALFFIALAGSPGISSASVQHNISFNDYDGIYWTAAQSRATFTFPSKDGGAGKAVLCDPATEFCWEYSQDTWDPQSNHYWFYVYDTTWGHYHLSFEDPLFYAQPGGAGCFVDPGDGDGAGMVRYQNGHCGTAPIDWAAQPRFLAAHNPGEIFDFFPDSWVEFDATSVTNKGDVNIFVLILADDGNYYIWDNLSAHSVLDISGFSWGIFEMWIGEAGFNSTNVVRLDDVRIQYN